MNFLLFILIGITLVIGVNYSKVRTGTVFSKHFNFI